jgi:phosphatidylserine/phosphatidylglycerophosphate/cardiolipin synthase-like enzyme
MTSKTEKSISTRLIVIALILLHALGLFICKELGLIGGDQAVREKVSGDWISVYFTSPRYPDEGDHSVGIDEDLAALIDRAESSVDLVAYDFDLESLTEALIAAHRRGVRVQMVTESDNIDDNSEALTRLDQAGVPIVEDERKSGLMHDKFAIVDERWVWTGSWNMTHNGSYRNNNNALLIDSPALADNYSAEFDEMLTGEFGPSSPADTPHPRVVISIETEEGQERQVELENYFAPEDETAARIIEEIQAAQSRIRFMSFIFTSGEIADAMLERARAGVVVQGVVESRNAERSYSQHEYLRATVHDVLPDGNPYIMHHKVIIIDDETVITGSYNFTKSAEESNDENTLIIHDPEVAALFVSEFGRIYEQARTAD